MSLKPPVGATASAGSIFDVLELLSAAGGILTIDGTTTVDGNIGVTGLVTTEALSDNHPQVALNQNAGPSNEPGITFGNGTDAPDLTLYRVNGSILKTDDQFHAESIIHSDQYFDLYQDGDIWQRVVLGMDTALGGEAGLRLGNGIDAPDTNLYRDAANTLMTDDQFVVEFAGTALEVRHGNGGQRVSVLTDTDKVRLKNTMVLEWEDGAGSWDTNLYRDGADILRTNDNFKADGYVGGAQDGSGEAFRVGGDASIWDVDQSNTMNIRGGQTPSLAILTLGSDGDTNLYRGAANTLKTDDAFAAVGAITSDSNITALGYVQGAGDSSGLAFKVGNDAEIHDVDAANTMNIRGASDAAAGIITFGSAGDTNLYRSGADALRTDDSLYCKTISPDDVVLFNQYASASAPNNSLFRDSADNKLKYKDNSGVVNDLY